MKEDNSILGFHAASIPVLTLSEEEVKVLTCPICRPFDTDGTKDVKWRKWSHWVQDESKEHIVAIPYHEKLVMRVKPDLIPKVEYKDSYLCYKGTEKNMPLDSCRGVKEYIQFSDFKPFQNERFTHDDHKWFGGELLDESIFSPFLAEINQQVLEIISPPTDNSMVVNTYKIRLPGFDVPAAVANKPPVIWAGDFDFPGFKDMEYYVKTSYSSDYSLNMVQKESRLSGVNLKSTSFEDLIESNEIASTTDAESSFNTLSETFHHREASKKSDVLEYFFPSQYGAFAKIIYYPERDCLVAAPWRANSWFMFIERRKVEEKRELVISLYQIDPILPYDSSSPGKTVGIATGGGSRGEIDKTEFNLFYDMVYSKYNESIYCIPFDSNKIVQIYYDKKTKITHFLQHDFPMMNKLNPNSMKFSAGVVSSTCNDIYCIPFQAEYITRVKIPSDDPLEKPKCESWDNKDWIIEQNNIMTPKLKAECFKNFKPDQSEYDR